jgi:pimeloyl-ACP methyl ester carboxylesterase
MIDEHRRQKKLERKRRRRGEKRRALSVEPSLPVLLPPALRLGAPKMSVALKKVAEPLLEAIPWEARRQDVLHAVRLAMLAWNAAVSFSPEDLDPELEAISFRILRSPKVARLSLLDTLRRLAERKQRLFPDDSRLALDVEVREEKDEFRIMVVSSAQPLKPAPRRSRLGVQALAPSRFPPGPKRNIPLPMPMTRFFPAQRGRLAYTDTGKGAPALVLVHGLPTAKELFAPVVPHLDSRCRVITFDLHDYGESERLTGPMLHTERAAALDELRAHLGLERFCLVAHDLGASVAVDYMGAFGEHVERLVLMSPPVYPDFQKPAVVDLARTRGVGPLLLWMMKDFMMRTSIRRGMHHPERFTPELQRAIMGAFDGPEGRAALLRNLRWGTPETTFARYPEFIRAIRVPTLVLQGVHDPYIPREHAERLARDIAGARLVLIEDGSHFLPMDTPLRVAEEINRFLGLP